MKRLMESLAQLPRRVLEAHAELGWRRQLAFAAGSRAAFLFLALCAIAVFPVNSYNRDHNAGFRLPTTGTPEDRSAAIRPGEPVSRFVEPRAIEVWARWDALWYLRIAEIGYGGWFATDRIRGKYLEPPATGFFPLMPLLMRGLAPFCGTPLRAGLIIANASLLAALWLLRRIGIRLLDASAAEIAGGLLLLYPTSFFLSAPYAESLGLALSLGCVLCALERRFWAAGIIGFFAALSRPTGFLLAIPIALEWWSARKSDRAPVRWASSLAALLPIAGFAAFSVYCEIAFGDFLAPIHRQGTWRGGLSWPPGVWKEITGQSLAILAPRSSWFEIVSMILFVAFGLIAFRYLPLSVAAFGFVTTLAPLATSLFSFSRLALASFPAFLAAGAVLRGRPAWARAMEPFFAMLLSVFAILYFTWNWIG